MGWLVSLILIGVSGATEAKSYIIASKLPAEVYKKYVEDENSAQMSGFTFVVVSIVQTAGGRITEGNASSRVLVLFYI